MRHFLLFLTFLCFCPGGASHGAEARKRLTLDLISRPEASVSRGISGISWHPSGSRLTYLRGAGAGEATRGALQSYDLQSGKESPLLNPAGAGGGARLSTVSYQWSPRGDSLLMQGENDLWLVDATTEEKRRLTKDRDEEEKPTFSPTGERVAFVKQNNLYALEIRTGLLEKLTSDGSERVLNGKLDWLYNEEMLFHAGGRSYQWSLDGTKIAYLRLDQSGVPEYTLTDFLPVHPRLTRQFYPKAGDPNPVPSVHVVAVGEPEPKSWTVPLPRGTEYIAPAFAWTVDSKDVAFLTLNRAQDELTVHLWEPAAGKEGAVLVEKDACWIDCLAPPRFLRDGRFLWLSERDGWLHLYLYSRDGRLLKQLTRGPWQIDPMMSLRERQTIEVDEDGGWAYFVATEKDPRERHLYRARLDGGGFERLTSEPGTHSLRLAPDGRHILETFSAVQQPPVVRLLRADGSAVTELDRSEQRLAEYDLAQMEWVEVAAPDGAKLYASLVKPVDFDPRKKYPVIVRVYGGPVAQLVQNRWGLPSMLDHFLAQEGFLIWTLDNRGSAGRGRDWETAIFKDLGKSELDDQLAGIAYLKTLPFVDAARLGIWGSSYGGYMTLYALTHAPDVFRCGVAGAPVTDWKLYDTLYTERYMRTPAENPEGYRRSSVVEAARKLKAAVLLIHGTADDNVHMQNTIAFVDALVKAGRPYELHLQPGASHGFSGRTTRSYLNERIVEFLKRHLEKPSPHVASPR